MDDSLRSVILHFLVPLHSPSPPCIPSLVGRLLFTPYSHIISFHRVQLLPRPLTSPHRENFSTCTISLLWHLNAHGRNLRSILGGLILPPNIKSTLGTFFLNNSPITPTWRQRQNSVNAPPLSPLLWTKLCFTEPSVGGGLQRSPRLTAELLGSPSCTRGNNGNISIPPPPEASTTQETSRC